MPPERMEAYSRKPDKQPAGQRALLTRSPTTHLGFVLPLREDSAVDELRTDRPTAVELLEIMAATLSETVVPATAPHAQHQARVVANLCRVLGRELASEESPALELPASLLDVDDATAEAAYPDVVALVRAKLTVNKPGYDSHGAAEERSIVA